MEGGYSMLITTLVLGLGLVILGIILLVSPNSLIKASKVTDKSVIPTQRLGEILNKDHSTEKVGEFLNKEIKFFMDETLLKFSRFFGVITLIAGIIICINYMRYR